MGRYYSGDIEGKFWFGVQDSTDPDFFGKKHFISEIGWQYSKKDIPKIEECLGKCIEELDSFLSGLNQFFAENEGYNDEMLLKFFNINGTEYSIKDIHNKLEWYARFELGKQILEGVKECDDIYFTTSDV